MRILFLPRGWTLLLCFILWPLLQVTAAFICLQLHRERLDPRSFFFRQHSVEAQGSLYTKIFRVRQWKHLLPDGGALWQKSGYRKRKLVSFSSENLNRFLVESCRAELSHWLAILPFWVFGFFVPPHIIWFMLLYALLVNLPCIIAQRYNRPRIQQLLRNREG